MATESAREQVIAAADRLFYAYGARGVGMDRVRDESGVSLKRIYSLFPSKEDLIIAVLAGRSAQWKRGLDEFTAGIDDPREKLLAIFDFLLSWFAEDEFHGCAFINAFGELSGQMPAVGDAVREQKAAFGRYVAELAAEMGAPASTARQLALLAEGAQTTAAIDGSTQPAVDARSAAVVLIDHALR